MQRVVKHVRTSSSRVEIKLSVPGSIIHALPVRDESIPRPECVQDIVTTRPAVVSNADVDAVRSDAAASL